MRHKTTEPTVGRVLIFEIADIEPERGTEMVGLLFLSAAGVVKMEPMIDA